MITIKNFEVGPKAQSLLESSLYPGVIAGGAARSELTGEKVSDYDIFYDPEFLDEGFNAIADDLVADGYKKVFVCPAGELISLKHEDGTHLQLIRKISFDPKDPKDLIDSFDFTVTQFVLFTNEANQYCLGIGSDLTLKDTVQKTLRVQSLTYPASTLNRMHKYRNRGYKSAPNLYEDICREISAREWSDDQMKLYPID